MTFCKGVGCPIRDTCYRHTAIKNLPNHDWVSMATTLLPEGEEDKPCPGYMPIGTGEEGSK